MGPENNQLVPDESVGEGEVQADNDSLLKSDTSEDHSMILSYHCNGDSSGFDEKEYLLLNGAVTVRRTCDIFLYIHHLIRSLLRFVVIFLFE